MKVQHCDPPPMIPRQYVITENVMVAKQSTVSMDSDTSHIIQLRVCQTNETGCMPLQ